LNTIRLNQALVRPLLIAGGERTPTGLVVGAGFGLLAFGWQFVSILCAVLGLFCLTVGLAVVQQLAKKDPQMFEVYRRYLAYRPFYPARPSVFGR
jgi:type IV secretory pathway TrbD component